MRMTTRALIVFSAGLLVWAHGCGSSPHVTAIETKDAFAEQVIASPRPVLVKFYKTFCPACGQFAPVYGDLSAEYEGRAEFYEVERNASSELRYRYGIGAYPTVILFLDGSERARWVNEHDRDIYRKAIDAALAESGDVSG